MSGVFKKRITTIKGLSERRRLPRLGVIRLGIKALSKKTGKEYPVETDYFVCPPEVQKVYGDKPTFLEIMIPLDDKAEIFPQSYCFYGSSRGLKCQGDGEVAYRVDEASKELVEVECPCELLEQKKCKQTGCFMFMIPKVSVGGIYQIRTSSYNSIVDINSGLDFAGALFPERGISFVPLLLERIPTETHHDEKKQVHHTLRITFPGNIDTINLLREKTRLIVDHAYQLPAPKLENPEMDDTEPTMIIDMEDEEQGAQEKDKPAGPADVKAVFGTTESLRKDFIDSNKDQQILILKMLIDQKGYDTKKLKKPISEFTDKYRLDFYNKLKEMPDVKPVEEEDIPF